MPSPEIWGPAKVQGLVAVVATVSKGYDLDWHIGFGIGPGLADHAELNDHLKVRRGTSYKL